jgi:hypothetical protein
MMDWGLRKEKNDKKDDDGGRDYRVGGKTSDDPKDSDDRE